MTAPAITRGPQTFRMDLRYRMLGIENKFIEAFRNEDRMCPMYTALSFHRKPTALAAWLWHHFDPGMHGG